MLKFGALLFNALALLIYQFFFADTITVTQNIPSSAKADSEFTVELTINKGSVGGFAKLQQDLPEGFTAVQDENSGASFTFSSQSVKFIWMSLPNDKEFKIKYKVKVAAGVSGDKTIAGKFSYVTDNVKQSIDISPSIIKIDGGAVPAVAAADTVNNTSAVTPSGNPSGAAESNSIVCTRKLPESASSDFTVEINVNKGNMAGFAKLVETLPAGFTASAGESQGAAFSFNEGKVKFVWVSMPAIAEFTLTYKVTVAAGTSGNQTIDGVFSFIENDETKKSVVPTSVISINSNAAAANSNTSGNDNTAVTPPDNTNAANNTAANTTADADKANKAAADAAADKAAADNAAKSLSASNIPSPQGSVNYKIQIAALHKAADAQNLAARYHITQTVETEMAEGFTKYLVGSHAEYKAAHDARETIKSKGVNDAFVTAYNSGKRITVQEALMITAQKWYR